MGAMSSSEQMKCGLQTVRCRHTVKKQGLTKEREKTEGESHMLRILCPSRRKVEYHVAA